MNGNNIHRLTFSYSLAVYICQVLGPEYQVKKLSFQVGKILQPGEQSANGLYAICSTKTNKVLRIAMNYELAQLMSDNHYRYLAEVGIVIKE